MVFQLLVKDIIRLTSDDASLPIGLTKVIHCLQYITTFPMGSAMHSEKISLKRTKVQCSKPRLSETFAFEAIILTSL